jgi:type I restriction enzyme S subunit
MKKGWEIKKLGEVCDFQNGFAFKSNTYKENGLPILRITNIQNQNLEINDLVYFDTKDYKENFERFKVFKGDLVVAMSGATTGKLGINNSDTIFYLNQRVGKFIPKRSIDKTFLYYFLSTKVEESLRIAAGAAQPNLSTEQINNFEIPLPPLPEQQRIVAILDEAFAAISKAKANAQQNLKNAKELFESYLQGVFENKGEGWEEKTIKELTTVLGDGLHGTPKYTIEGEYHFINGNNLTDGVIELKENTKRVSVKEYNKYKKNLTDRTVLVSINGTLGNIAFYNGEKIILGKSACYFNLKDSVDKDFVKYVLTSPYFLQYAHKESTGATIKNVSLKTMREFLVPLPPLKTQQAIVQKLDALNDETKKLESIYKQKINDLEQLKKSILQKAFSGELKTEKAEV